MATGLVDELPDVPGVAERWGRDVLHCPYCHGCEIRDQSLGVLATGPMAEHQALLFRQWSADATLFRHTAPDLGDEQREELAARGIEVVDGQVTALEVTDDRLTGVRLDSGQLIPRQVVVVMPRFVARADVLITLGLEPTERELAGHVIGSSSPADPGGATPVPGVWVTGNVSDPLGGVINAAASGLSTAAALSADLIAEDTRQAVDAYRHERQLATHEAGE